MLKPFTHGALGVSFFFVLSGFVLVWSTRPDDTAWPFLRRRFEGPRSGEVGKGANC